MTRSTTPATSRSSHGGAALAGVLIVLFWLTGVTGWLVAHAAFSSRQGAQEAQLSRLAAAADGLAALGAVLLGDEADWGLFSGTVSPAACPGAPMASPLVDVALEAARWQAASDAAGRWSPGVRPVWRPWLICDARGLFGDWRAHESAPWVLALVADDPDGATVAGAPVQVAVVAIAGNGGDARVRRVVTVRRSLAPSPPRIVGWRAG